MRATISFLAAAIALSLSSCEKLKEAAEKSADAALESAKAKMEEEIRNTVADSGLMKSGLEYKAKAEAALAQVDVGALKRQVEGVKNAIAAGDYTQAQQLSQAVDKYLETDVVGQTVGLMKIRVEEGTSAANRKLREYLAVPGMDAAQKKHLEELGSRLSNFKRTDTDAAVKHLALAIASGCEDRFGHGGGGLVISAMSAVLPGIMEGKQATPEVEDLPLEVE